MNKKYALSNFSERSDASKESEEFRLTCINDTLEGLLVSKLSMNGAFLDVLRHWITGN